MSVPYRKLAVVFNQSEGQYRLKYEVDRKVFWKRIPKEHKTPKAASVWAAMWLAQQASEGAFEKRAAASETSPGQGEPLIAQAFPLWKKARAQLSRAPATLEANRSQVELHFLPSFAEKRFSELDSKALCCWLEGLKARFAPNYVRNIYNSAALFADWALDSNSPDTNPLRRPSVLLVLPPARTVAGPAVIIHLTLSQGQSLFGSSSIPMARRARYILAGLTGMADGEIAGLRWGSIYLEEGIAVVEVDAAFGRVSQKLGLPKNDFRLRKIPLHPLALNALRLWCNEWAVLFGHTPRRNDPVFPNSKGEHYRPNSAPMFRKDLQSAGLEPQYRERWPFNFKSLRASFASWLAEVNVPEELRERLMGHAGATVERAHYTASELQALYQAVCQIPLALDLLGAGTQTGTQPLPTQEPFTVNLCAQECIPMRFSENICSAVQVPRTNCKNVLLQPPSGFSLPTIASSPRSLLQSQRAVQSSP